MLIVVIVHLVAFDYMHYSYLLGHLPSLVHLVYMSVGSRAVGLGGLKGFSRICSDVGVEPKKSEGILEVLRCERSGGVSGNVLLKISEVVGDNDWGISK